VRNVRAQATNPLKVLREAVRNLNAILKDGDNLARARQDKTGDTNCISLLVNRDSLTPHRLLLVRKPEGRGQGPAARTCADVRHPGRRQPQEDLPVAQPRCTGARG